ncbi:MAG: hypothetical protein P8Q97_05835 [Myxococcota bacterium]|nr:hypothetical protein [Myxococcota bacterium]
MSKIVFEPPSLAFPYSDGWSIKRSIPSKSVDLIDAREPSFRPVSSILGCNL